jgi:hypothetical protein
MGVASFEPGEGWFYDYQKKEMIRGVKLLPPDSHPTPDPKGNSEEAIVPVTLSNQHFRGAPLDTQAIIEALENKLENVNHAIAALRGGDGAQGNHQPGHGNKGRRLSPAARKTNQYRHEKALGGEEEKSGVTT